MNRAKSIACWLAVCLAFSIGIGHSAVRAAGPHHPAGCACQQCEPLIPNLKQFGFYQTKWRRWPGYRAAKHSPGRGAQAEIIPTPLMETELPAGGQPGTTVPQDTTPAVPSDVDPLQPNFMTEPTNTAPGLIPDSGNPPFDPLNLPELNGSDDALLPPEEMPSPQSNHRAIRSGGYAASAASADDMNAAYSSHTSPWRPRSTGSSQDARQRLNVLRTAKDANEPASQATTAPAPSRDPGVVPAANWTLEGANPRQSPRGNPLRSSAGTVKAPANPAAAAARQNPLRSK